MRLAKYSDCAIMQELERRGYPMRELREERIRRDALKVWVDSPETTIVSRQFIPKPEQS